jgi:hypothetical protein
MSMEAITYVWKTSKMKGSALLLMLALADHTDERGESWPSIRHLAKKCRVTPRHLKTLINQCEVAGELLVAQQEGTQGSHGKTNRYFLPTFAQHLKNTRQIKIKPKKAKKSSEEPAYGFEELADQIRAEIDQSLTAADGVISGSRVIPTSPQGVIPESLLGVIPTSPKSSLEPSIETSIISPEGEDQKEEEKQQEEKQSSKKTTRPYYDAIAAIFDCHGSRNGLIEKMLRGTATRKGYKEHNLEEPISDPQELWDWFYWYQEEKMTEDSVMITSPEKINSAITGWQEMGRPKIINLGLVQSRMEPLDPSMKLEEIEDGTPLSDTQQMRMLQELEALMNEAEALQEQKRLEYSKPLTEEEQRS